MAMDDDDDVVRFASTLFYAKEVDNEVRVAVLRSGEPSNPCSVRCYTKDLSGQAGVRYTAIDILVEFAAGQSISWVTVPILQDTAWHTCEEFEVKLSDPQDCHVRGGTCRVKIIDQDCFPHNDLAEFIAFGDLDEVSHWTFASRFLQLCWNQAGVPWKSAVTVAIVLTHNVYFLLTVYLKVYLINILLAKAVETAKPGGMDGLDGGDLLTERRLLEGIQDIHRESGGIFGNELFVPGNLQATALIVGACYLLPFALLHVLDVVKARLGLSGALKTMLMSALFRRFMSFKPTVRQQVSDAEISMMCVRDIPELVSSGFMSVFKLIHIFCQVLVTMGFLFMEDQLAIVPFAVYPILAAVWMCLRRHVMKTVQDDKVRTANDLVKGVQQACMNFNLILDYRKRSRAVDRFTSVATSYRKAMSAGSLVDLNNSRFFPWITTISMASYVLVGVQQLQEGATTIGTFVATFGIFREVGHELEAGYETLIDMFQAFHVVKQLTRMLNLETDDADRMETVHKRLEVGMHERQRLLEELAKRDGSQADVSDSYRIVDDMINIKLSNLTHVRKDGDREMRVLDNVSMELQQGKIIAIYSGEREGKSTVLRVIAGNLRATEGHVFVPPHLDVLQVEDTPSFLPESLKRNLIFGVSDHELSSLAQKQRVQEICTRLNFSSKLLRRLEQDWNNLNKEDDASWITELTSTDEMQIHLARALISNPHVLVLHKPFMRFPNARMQEAAFSLLKDFVQFRGVCLSANSKDEVLMRRSRTVILSAFHATEIEQADELYVLRSGKMILAQPDQLFRETSGNRKESRQALKSSYSMAPVKK